MGVLTSGGADGGDGLGVLKDGGDMGRLVEREVRGGAGGGGWGRRGRQ